MSPNTKLVIKCEFQRKKAHSKKDIPLIGPIKSIPLLKFKIHFLQLTKSEMTKKK